MHDSQNELPTAQREMSTPASTPASYRPRHSSPSGKASLAKPAPGVAGTDRHQGAQVRKAATGGGSQPEEKQTPSRKRRSSTNASRKRSPKPRAHKRVHVCSVRLNDEEKNQLAAAASAARTSLPAFLARCGLAAAADLDATVAAIAGRRELVSELFAARRHLGYVGNNLNQVASALNSGARPAELDAVIAATESAVKWVQDAADQLLAQN